MSQVVNLISKVFTRFLLFDQFLKMILFGYILLFWLGLGLGLGLELGLE
jgi:hypothetical protein